MAKVREMITIDITDNLSIKCSIGSIGVLTKTPDGFFVEIYLELEESILEFKISESTYDYLSSVMGSPLWEKREALFNLETYARGKF